jgi:uncharacterized protein with FMN-binding domain
MSDEKKTLARKGGIAKLGLALFGLALTAALSACASSAAKAEYYDSLTVADPDLGVLADGSYRGAHTLTVPLGVYAANPSVEVEVSVSGHRYQDIVVLTKAVSTWPHLAKLRDLIVENQSLQVDALTGATSLTGKAYLKAVAKALGGSE